MSRRAFWLMKTTNTTYEYMGEHHEDDGTPFAVMREVSISETNNLLKVDPLELVKEDGRWEIVNS